MSDLSEHDTDDLFEQLLGVVIGKSNEHAKEDQVANSLFCFLIRVSNTWRSIRTLRDQTPDDDLILVDAGALLRCMFDAYVQAAYVASDKNKAAERAQEYFDFEHIDRFRWHQRVLKYDNILTRRARSSKTFADVTRAIEDAYDRVKGSFPDKKHWYPGNLFVIAELLGKSDEYDTLLAALHGCVHSNISALKAGWVPIPSAQNVLMWATSIVARTAKLSVQHNRISLSNVQVGILDICSQPYLALQQS